MNYSLRLTRFFLNAFTAKTTVKSYLASVGRRLATSDCNKKEGFSLVPVYEARRFMEECLIAVGTCKQHAEEMADVLIAADSRGHYSHGMNRLEVYINDIEAERLRPNECPTILKETLSSAWVDGNNGLGAVVGNFCMKLALEKACCSGVGWVVAKGSNHFGINSYYSMQALKSGMVGLTFTNTAPFMSPTRAKQAALGTNPLSISAPCLDGESVILDMATTTAAVGKIELHLRKGQPIPETWALGPDGKVTTDPKIALETAAILPLGGLEKSSGFKGYGLALAVEILCGIMAGSAYGPNINHWKAPAKNPANLGQCFVAIDPNCFAPDFEERITDLTSHLRNMPPVNEELPVLIAGDKEKANMQQAEKIGGLMYVENQMKTCLNLALRLQVCSLRPRCKIYGCQFK